jgi:uncharacterized membrane protein YhaH (DUF805 family)
VSRYLSALRSYAVFPGRAWRQEFWTFTLVNIIISVALQLLVKSPVPYTFEEAAFSAEAPEGREQELS